MRRIKRWLSFENLRANEREEGQEKPGKEQQRKRGTRWGGRAGGQQGKLPETARPRWRDPCLALCSLISKEDR